MFADVFGGGRDSTIAAVRLARTYRNLILVTVTADHLIGIENVKRRVAQLKPHVSEETEWLVVAQPPLPRLESLAAATCLPCQRAYAVIGAIVALQRRKCDLAMGYAKYQAAWPEQSAQATSKLERVLEGFGVKVTFPVYDLDSKAAAQEELARYGLVVEALEQKCLRQESYVEIPPALLDRELDVWAASITRLLEDAQRIPVAVTSQQRIVEI
jgi:hypothetical protein